MTSRVGQQRWSRCCVAAQSRQTSRSQGWQKSRSSWPRWRLQRTGRLRTPPDFSSFRQRTEWDAVRFCRLEEGRQAEEDPRLLGVHLTPPGFHWMRPSVHPRPDRQRMTQQVRAIHRRQEVGCEEKNKTSGKLSRKSRAMKSTFKFPDVLFFLCTDFLCQTRCLVLDCTVGLRPSVRPNSKRCIFLRTDERVR